MKTISDTKKRFPKPMKFAMYLVLVSAFCLLNYMTTYANDPGYKQVKSLEIRLAEALVPLADPEQELEDWILTFSNNIAAENDETKTDLESRLAEALKPIADHEPEIGEWLLTLSDEILEK
jgi:hypothetical protein